ncbi:MAG: DUF1003 domain-containing protein [Spirochaetales bacterium]|nr:DUF1003 domain-containing protein [Spirochaetales bacterium]
MKKELFPPPYEHKHPPIRNVNDLLSEKLATGQKIAEKDRIEAHNDYQVNLKSEEEVRAILKHLHAQNNALAELLSILSDKKQTQK